MANEKDIEKIKLIIAENMAAYSKAKMPYDEALKMCALGILASGYGDTNAAVREFGDKLINFAIKKRKLYDRLYDLATPEQTQLAGGFISKRNEWIDMKQKIEQMLKEYEK